MPLSNRPDPMCNGAYATAKIHIWDRSLWPFLGAPAKGASGRWYGTRIAVARGAATFWAEGIQVFRGALCEF